MICYDRSIVKIFYFNERAHQQIVANLIAIIGKDTLIQFVSGENPKIEFIKQRPHRFENTAGLEITRDIYSIYKLHNLNNTAVEELLLKVKRKIEEKDLSYFYSQKKCISLFEALKYQHCEYAKLKDFIVLCESMEYERTNLGKLIIYQEEEWNDFTPWGEEIFCNEETARLIFAVNESNKKDIRPIHRRYSVQKFLHPKQVKK